MRIIQIIDTLNTGGAEKMAVNYANVLSERIDFSGLVTTRKEGNLKVQLNSKVHYLFLNRTKTVDFTAILRLKRYCKVNRVEYVHAHGTSFFVAFLLKLVYLKIKIIWHDHSGARADQGLKVNKLLWLCSKLFSGIVVVNHTLENWCKDKLRFKKVIYLPNFIPTPNLNIKETFLKGSANKRILCLANLREPKNHNLLLDVAILINKTHPDWSFHFIGSDFNDSYSSNLKEKIKRNELEDIVYIYGLKNDIPNIIQQATICVFSSTSEGLPVALLEYGLLKKPVVSTDVGEIPLIIKNAVNGYISPANNVELFYEALVNLMENESLRNDFGLRLYQTILANNSEVIVVNQYQNWVNTI